MNVVLRYLASLPGAVIGAIVIGGGALIRALRRPDKPA